MTTIDLDISERDRRREEKFERVARESDGSSNDDGLPQLMRASGGLDTEEEEEDGCFLSSESINEKS